MNYRISVCKKTNVITVELLQEVTNEMIREFKENSIYHVNNLIHFRLKDESNVLNKMDKLPKALQIIEKIKEYGYCTILFYFFYVTLPDELYINNINKREVIIMFITAREIRKRVNNLNGNYNLRYNINVRSISEQSLSNVNTFEKYINNWRELHSDEYIALTRLLESVNKFKDINKSKSDYKKVLYMVAEKTIPQIRNIKRARVIINKFSNLDIDNILLDECNMYISCDRVLNNQTKLNKLYDIDSVVKENNIHDDESLENCIHELCEIISSFDIDMDIKYNLALENILYTLDKNYIYCDRVFILESVTNYFLAKYPESLDTFREVLQETVYYNDKDKKELDFILDDEDFEGSLLSIEPITESLLNKKNEVKEIINKLKKTRNITSSIMKSAVNKIYTKSPNNIIDETPNFLSWIRTGLLFSTLGVNIYLGLIILFVDKFIQMSLQRKETDRFLAKFKNEKEKAEKKLGKLKDENTKKKLEEYIKTLDNNIKKIEEYRETLYIEKELDNMSESTDLRKFLEEDVITYDEYIKNHGYIVQREYISARDKYNNIVNTIYKNLKDITLIENKSTLSLSDNNCNINGYLDNDNRLMIPIANIYPVHYEGDIIEVIEHIIELIEPTLEEHFVLIYEGDEDLYCIYLSYDFKICDIPQDNNLHNDLVREASLVLSLEESCNEYIKHNDILDTISNNINSYSEDDIDYITNISLQESDILDPVQLSQLIEKHRECLYESNHKDKYRLGSCINENMFKIKTNRNKVQIRKTRYELCNDLSSINEALEALENINETSMKTNIAMARERLKKAAVNLSDKEKTMSRQLDNSLDKFNDNIQRELSNKNREAVIKGRVLPSASSVIKIALATGVAAMINPAIAVVAAIGGIAASKAGTKKEKQFILDEIEIQLKLVEKKIQLAESNNDMKALEQLLKLEQKLKRERQRIIYRLKHYYPVTANNN